MGYVGVSACWCGEDSFGSGMKVTVRQSVQVVHEGVVFGPGESANVPDDVAALWISHGWVVRDEGVETRQRRTVRSK